MKYLGDVSTLLLTVCNIEGNLVNEWFMGVDNCGLLMLMIIIMMTVWQANLMQFLTQCSSVSCRSLTRAKIQFMEL